MVLLGLTFRVDIRSFGKREKIETKSPDWTAPRICHNERTNQ